MSSRESILSAVTKNQPVYEPIPTIPKFEPYFDDVVVKFTEVLGTIGATVHLVTSYEEIVNTLLQTYTPDKPIVNTVTALSAIGAVVEVYDSPHALEQTELTIIEAAFGVAENGAVWITEDSLPARVVPFIAQHLAVVLHKSAIVPTMHHAYEKINTQHYRWGAFIAGPSKTADIEQSLVLGAHGPRSMVLFLIDAAE